VVTLSRLGTSFFFGLDSGTMFIFLNSYKSVYGSMDALLIVLLCGLCNIFCIGIFSFVTSMTSSL
jgi:hypothetical protein